MAIVMRSQRGKIGTTWLATQFLELAETTFGTRGKAKGKQFARAGAIEWIDVHEGHAEGSFILGADAAHPRIDFGPLRPHDLAAFQEYHRHNPATIIELIAGRYGPAHETSLNEHGLSLLPGEVAHLSYSCTCMAWPAVCEHIYALLYVMIEHIDDSPASYLLILGIDPEKLSLMDPGRAPGRDETGGDAGAGGVGMHPVFEPGLLDYSRLETVVSPEVAGVFRQFYKAACPSAE